MPDIEAYLGTIAEFSIGLAGFSGIVAALATYHRAHLVLVKFRFANLLVSSFAPGFFALLTFTLISSAIEIDPALRISSGALAACLGAWAVFVYLNRPAGISRALLILMSTATTANIVVQVASATGLSAGPATAYLAGLVLLLLQGAVVFVVLAMDALQSGSDAR